MLPAPPKTGPYGETLAAPPADRDVILEVPVEGAAVTGDLMDIAGRALASKGAVAHITVRTADGTVLVTSEARVLADAGASFGRFGVVLPLPEHPFGAAHVEVSLRTPAGEIASITRSFTFAEPDTVPIKIFLGRTAIGADDPCDTVVAVERLVSSKTAVYRAVLEELLKGPDVGEKRDGLSTAIPAGVAVRSVAADAEGIVTADFSEQLDKGVAGSCRVTAIRAQIEATLKQFPEVRDVIIAVNGDAEESLQP